jgi:hypothetical protein
MLLSSNLQGGKMRGSSAAQRLRNEVAEWVEEMPLGNMFSLSEVYRRFDQRQKQLGPDLAAPKSQLRRIMQMLKNDDKLVDFIDDRGTYRRR